MYYTLYRVQADTYQHTPTLDSIQALLKYVCTKVAILCINTHHMDAQRGPTRCIHILLPREQLYKNCQFSISISGTAMHACS